MTHAISPGASPARDAIPAGGLCSALFPDQHGVARPQGAGCDVGAVESEVLDSPAPMSLLAGSGPNAGRLPLRG